ncbi:MAG: Bug family tripartite tricarboxylate transporter substrate binding protein [Xanthobacteraceae bacterium]
MFAGEWMRRRVALNLLVPVLLVPVLLGPVLLAVVLSATAYAQDFPSRPITIMVGLAPGGITDVTARLYAEVVSQSIGQRIVIENRQGAGGALAAAAVQYAAPDGYTLLVFSGSQHAAVPAVQSAPYEPVKVFQPITLLFDLAAVVAVPASSPANTLPELLTYGRTKAGGLLFGSPGVGSPSHLLAAKLGAATNTPMQFVHYRGGAPMMADLVTGRVDFSLASYTVAKGFLLENRLKGLAVDASVRLSVLPEVPTLTEAGLGAAKVASWFALAAPAGTSAGLVTKLRDHFINASNDAELKRRLAENGTLVHTSTPQEMARFLAEEVESTNLLVQSLGLRQQ